MSGCECKPGRAQPVKNGGPDAENMTVRNLAQTNLRDALSKLQKNVADVQAIVLLGPGGVVDHVQLDPNVHIETIAIEYGTLLRVAGRASEDSGAGSLIEHIVVSDRSIMIARTISPEHFLILLCGSQDQLGRARYELKQAAWELAADGRRR
jgi:predicted regulator of Ras-like GTPase activity (Roadblock/LC7/MglB family)